MKYRRLLPILALLLALSACKAPAADVSPSPSPSQEPPSASPDLQPSPSPAPGGWTVTTHWDALDGPEDRSIISNRLNEEPMTELVPSDSYGTLVPYIGGEQEVFEPWEDENGNNYSYTTFLYGLCTADGLIVTDAVYRMASQPSRYDSYSGVSFGLPAWILTQTAQDENGEYYTAVGLAAQDGSWYTGLRYESGLSTILAASDHSVLMKESDDAAVLVSLADGSELARYSPYDFLSEEESDYASWFFDDGLSWGMMNSFEDYLCYDPQHSGMLGRTVWIDGKTGELLDEAPFELPGDPYQPDRGYLTNGWYEQEGDSLVIHYSDGSTESLPLPDKSLGTLSGISGDYLFFRGERWSDATLTDRQGNILATGDKDRVLYLTFDLLDGSAFPWIAEYPEEGNYQRCRVTYLKTDGSSLITFETDLGWCSPSLGLLPVADDEAYRLIDLNDGCKELIRLPRWSAMDFPADD